jgi:hypothetical protein
MRWHGLLAVCGLVVVTQAPVAEAAKNDVDQDGRSDLLIRRIAPHCTPDEEFKHNNAHVVWGVRPGSTNLGFESLYDFDSSIWKVAASGDFNGDGLPDLYWERMEELAGSPFHETVRVDVKAALTAAEPVIYDEPDGSPGDGAPPESWFVVGSGDFVGSDSTAEVVTIPDGRADLVWQDAATGAMALWASDGGSFPHRLRFTLPSAEVGSTAVAVGDLNGDTLQEIVFSSASEDLSYWSMEGLTRVARGDLEPKRPVDTRWKVGGAGDFNRDATDDLVFLHTETYRVAVWYMNDRVTGQRLDGGWAELVGTGAPDPTHRCDSWAIAGPR